MLRTLILFASLLPTLALAQAIVGPPLRGRAQVINNGPGHQTDPHVSGSRVAYTHQDEAGSQIRYHEMLTGEDWGIPNDGGYDFVADISGDTVVFTRISGPTAVYRYDVSQRGQPELPAPRPVLDRRSATVGERTVVWQDFGYTSKLAPEVVIYGLDTGVLTRLSEDALLDRTASVSPDGTTTAWAKCALDGTACDIWHAWEVEGGYEVSRLTGAGGEESQPDTNGEVVVYVTRQLLDGAYEWDIAWQPVGGGPVQRLALPGVDANPNVSGSLIAFERRSSDGDSFDIVLYDLRTQTFYRLTETPENETLSDISVSEDGLVRVVWSVMEKDDLNVYAYTFRIPEVCEPVRSVEAPSAICDEPGAWRMLGSLEVGRVAGRPEVDSTNIDATGTGVLCVDNGFGGSPATAGEVALGEGLYVEPDSFKHDVEQVARVVPLQGLSRLSAWVAGAPGSAFRVRVYGEPVCGSEPDDSSLEGGELRYGTLVAPESQGAPADKSLLERYFVPAGYEGKDSEGQPAGGASAAAPEVGGTAP
ncbi:MAG TPA: hypothetical protein VLQ93_14040, partial [Myxococcaceae bacterium]|nr:hypothetical protein [Myxococcaceae bacterium]